MFVTSKVGVKRSIQATMKTSAKRLVTGISAIGLGFGMALPSMAQSQFTPSPETTPANAPQTPAPTNRDTGIPPVGGQTGTQASPRDRSNTENMGTPDNSGTSNRPALNTPAVPNNESTPGVVAPANRPEVNNLPSGSASTGSSYSFAGSDKESIDQIVRSSPSFELFNALVRVADSSGGGFSTELASTDGYTVFAPTDEALAAIPPATFKALVQPENRALLTQVLENHIVKGKVSSSDLAAKQVRSMGGNPIVAQGGTGSLMVGNARVVGPDIQASNGVIHAIDQVILPADVQSKLSGLAPQASAPMSQPMP